MKVEVNETIQIIESIGFKQGDIVSRLNDTQIVLVTKVDRDNTFRGVVLKHDSYVAGDYSKGWVTNLFSLYNGTITISN